MILNLKNLVPVVEAIPYPPLFVTVSGAHLYGFPSPDSDVDLRGAFVLPVSDVLGLDQPQETISKMRDYDGTEMDLVAHDIKKFLSLLLRKNGYVLEQIYSPLVVYGDTWFDELRELAQGAITRHVYHHYAGFARNKIKEFESHQPRYVKTLLYIYRVLCTGIHLLNTGEVEANLLHLNDTFHLPFVPDLVAQKGREKAVLDERNLPIYRAAFENLLAQLEESFTSSSLPEMPLNHPALNDFLIRARLHFSEDTE